MIIQQQTEQLEGNIERVTFHSEESGFCVLQVKSSRQRDCVTIIGQAASVSAGEYVKCQGMWINDKKHGLQFKAQQLNIIPPSTLEGIEKYLGSGIVKGIGKFFSRKLVSCFGESVFDVIETEPHRLTELEGIGKKRKERIVTSWSEQKAIRHIMVFLQSHGVGTARAVRIYKTYGDQAVDKIRDNPYCLAKDIHGIGFKTADELAGRLGIEKCAPIRVRAGVQYALQVLCDRGHCAAEIKQLVSTGVALLEVPSIAIEEAIQYEIKEKNVIPDVINDQPCLYLTSLYYAETKSVEQLKRLNKADPPWSGLKINEAVEWVSQKNHISLSSSQRQAMVTVLKAKLSIITGGPGVGKTTLVQSVLSIICAKRFKVALCAPTGRAAKRLEEATQLSAQTIHRLLDFNPRSYSFNHNEDNPLPIDTLIVDESSMIDIVLFYQLLRAVPSHAAIIFLGDVDQLPSVGPGAVLSDLIQSKFIVTAHLTEIFRQADSSYIIKNAHRVNRGKMPLPNASKDSDFFTIYADSPETIHEQLVHIVADRLPHYYGCDPIQDIQVLTPMQRGGLGSRSLSIALKNKLNIHSGPQVKRFGISYSPKDKVIQLKNNYDKGVFNGDIGFIKNVNLEDQIVEIYFDQFVKCYDFSELDELSLAYAITIHKSQGSEFPIIVLPLSTSHYNLLARNLLYTGITRGKKLVVLIGQKKPVGMAVHNNKAVCRLTKLAQRLQ